MVSAEKKVKTDEHPRCAKILFRTDGTADIGAGHVRRCLTLASELRNRGHECLFVCRSAALSFNDLIASAGFALFELPEAASVDEMHDADLVMRAVAAHAPFDVIVVDHYRLGRTWEQALRAIAGQVVVIDDLADRHHECDVLVDVAPGPVDRYSSLVPEHCRTLLGPTYALLRPDFRALRSAREQHSGSIAQILISVGGVDADNVTGSAITAVRRVLPDVIIDAVVTTLSPHRDALQRQAERDAYLRITVDAENMAELMSVADLAIGAGGSTSWERACLGLPSIVVSLAENQQRTINALEAAGCAITVALGPDFIADTARVVALLSASPGLRRLMSSAASSVVDGQGTRRVASAILPATISLRPATDDDCRAVWEWRNSPDIRTTAIDRAEIAWEHHRAWFTARIDDPLTVMLIAEQDGVASGVVRFDLDRPVARVSIFLAPGASGRGLGRIVLCDAERWVSARFPEVNTFHADVRPENLASIALFTGANYTPAITRFERSIDGAA